MSLFCILTAINLQSIYLFFFLVVVAIEPTLSLSVALEGALKLKIFIALFFPVFSFILR